MKRVALFIAMTLTAGYNLLAQELHLNEGMTNAKSGGVVSVFNNKIILRDTTYNKEYYLEKSKNQKTAGWIMLGGGVGLMAVGIIGASANYSVLGDNSSSDTYAVVGLIGLGFSLGSIPFFVSSSHNAWKAANLSFKNQNISIPLQKSFVYKMQPSISLSITL